MLRLNVPFFFYTSHKSFNLVGLIETSVFSLLTIIVTVNNENRCVQFYGFHHEYQQPNVHFVET